MPPIIVSVSGTSSEVGKTTLICELLRCFPGWEAVKITRGHFRSCGRDPDTCCVSPMLGDRPLVLSGREETFVEGKDTARYWEAGAGNVHWVVVTTRQLKEGCRIALERVSGPGVLIEGTSFLANQAAAYSIMVTTATPGEIKSSALRMMPRMDAVYLNCDQPGAAAREQARIRLSTEAPVYSRDRVADLAAHIRRAVFP